MSQQAPQLASLAQLIASFAKQVDDAKSLANFSYTRVYRGLLTRAGFGMGAAARVPWLGFFPDASARPSVGSYPVLLYYKRAKVLVVAYGIGEGSSKESLWRSVECPTVADALPRTHGHVPERYGSSLMACSFETSSTVDYNAVANAVDLVIDDFFKLQPLGDRND